MQSKLFDKEYYYDAFGRKLHVRGGTQFQVGYQYSIGERWVYDNDSVVEVYAYGETSDPSEVYVHGIDIDEPICLRMKDISDMDGDANTTEKFNLMYSSDAQGSVMALTLGYGGDSYDVSGVDVGDVLERYFYDAYGRPYIEPYSGSIDLGESENSGNSSTSKTSWIDLESVSGCAKLPNALMRVSGTGKIHQILKCEGDKVVIPGVYTLSTSDTYYIEGFYLGSEFVDGWLPGVSYRYKLSLNRFLFQGREWDHHAEAYDFRARWYSPRLGRFLSRDPMGYLDSMNLYGFERNNPVCLRDPSGEIAPLVALGLIALGAAILGAGADTAIQTDGFQEWDEWQDGGWKRSVMVGVVAGATVATMGMAAAYSAGAVGIGGVATIGTTGTVGLGEALAVGTFTGLAGGVTYGALDEALVDPDAKRFYNPYATPQSIMHSSATWGLRGAAAAGAAVATGMWAAHRIPLWLASTSGGAGEATRRAMPQTMRTVTRSPATRQFLRPLTNMSPAERAQVFRWLRESRMLRIAQEKGTAVISQQKWPYEFFAASGSR